MEAGHLQCFWSALDFINSREVLVGDSAFSLPATDFLQTENAARD